MATSKNTRLAHIVNLLCVAGIDGNITDEERNTVIKIAENLGLTEDDFDLCIEIWKKTDENEYETIVPEDDDDKLEYLKNLVLVMMVDGEIDDNERKYIAGLAEQFGYEGEDAVNQLIDMVYNEYFAQDNEEEEEEEFDEELDEDSIKDARIDLRLFRLTDEQLESIKKLADHGNAEAMYVLGRYHLIVKPDDDSIDKALNLIKLAAKNNVADAYAELARMTALGYYEPIKDDQYNKLIARGIDEGSSMALKMKMEDIIYGTNGYESLPKNVIKFLEENYVNDDDEVFEHPYFYAVLGDAYNKLGNKAKAADCYEQAIFADYKEAAYKKHATQLEGMNPLAKEMYAIVIDMDCDDDVPGCFTLRATMNEDTPAEKVIEDLVHDYELGFGPAATKLGNIYYLGEYGVERDPQEAWQWFYRGARREDGAAFSGLAMMMKDGVYPDSISDPDEFLAWCQQNAHRRGKGAPDMHFLAIIKPDGSTMAYNFIKDDWNKVAGYIGAKRLAPIRVDALDAIGEKLGISGHITAWVDIEAPRKKMPLNVAAKKFYKGVIAGDIVLTLADNIWDPMFFSDINELKGLIKALGGKLVDVITDELALDKTKREYTKISRDLLNSESGFVARIQPDNTAHIVDSSHKMFALVEEDIYDPIRLESIYKQGEKLGLKGRLTIWTDNSSLRKQMIMNNKNEMNAIGMKIFPGPVADNFFVAMEDENYNIMLFDDAEKLKETVIALGVKPNKIIVD